MSLAVNESCLACFSSTESCPIAFRFREWCCGVFSDVFVSDRASSTFEITSRISDLISVANSFVISFT